MKKLILMLLCFLMLTGLVFADGKSFSWDFADCEIKDILFAVSLDTGISITCDDTVSGKSDFKFAGKNFEVAFDAFLNGNRLFVEKTDVLWTVSKIRISRENGLFSVDAYDLSPAEILEKISCVFEVVVTYDALPGGKISVHLKDLRDCDLLNALAKQFGSYIVQRSETGFHVGKSVEIRKIESADSFVNVFYESGKLKVDVKNSKFCDVIEKVFKAFSTEDKSFSIISNGESKIVRICFEENDFEKALGKISSQSGYNFVLKDKVYYFFENAESKEELVYGSRNWICYKLKYSSAQEILPLVLKKLGKVDSYTLSDSSCFYARVNENENREIETVIEEMDIKKSVSVVNLKYIKPEELLKHLPPSVDKANLFMADDNSCLYFKGTEEAYKNFCQQISICDRPEIRVTYDLLIIQYDETSQNSWNTNFGIGNAKLGDRNVISGQLGSVLGLNINVVSAFGLNFAASLQGSIEDNKSSVYADTTLHGINGKPISFTNSSTYRYRDNNLDPETGKPVYSGITREIVSGINIQVTPWVSGDGMITSCVKASISRQGIDTSASTGNPPPTTEKVITTEVSSKSGEPVVLSGLIQSSLSEDSKGLPLVGRIPGIKKVLNSSEKNKEKSQMVIYLVPRIEEDCTFVEKEREVKLREKIKELLELVEA